MRLISVKKKFGGVETVTHVHIKKKIAHDFGTALSEIQPSFLDKNPDFTEVTFRVMGKK